MTLLLDTHALLWFDQGDPALSRTAKLLIEDPANTIRVSIATCWEIAVKAGTGKLRFGLPANVYLADALVRNNFDLLDLTFSHVTAVESLPLHHRDPFDRILIAQAMAENVPLVSVDAAFDPYPVTRLW
jgi:PIN domain nuclease of toxin-antitoxin system